MAAIRGRLASGALALTVLQLALLFGAPVSACCLAPGASGRIATAAAAAAADCCPAGSHAPGECPLHKSSRQASCRMLGDAPHAPQLLLGVVGLIIAPAAAHVDAIASTLPVIAPKPPTIRGAVPDAPPPRLL